MKKATDAVAAETAAPAKRKAPKRKAAKSAKRRAAAPAPKAPARPRAMSAAEIAALRTVGAAYTETGYIETLSPLKTPNGGKQTEITINQHVYRFLKNPDGHYVTQVPYADDFAAILSIGAGYQRYGKTRKTSGNVPRGATLMPTIDEEPVDEMESDEPAPVARTRAAAAHAVSTMAVDPAAG